MNEQLLILLGIFVLASITSFIRAVFFDTAGEKFVARLRRTVGLGMGLRGCWFVTYDSGEVVGDMVALFAHIVTYE